ncbi:receptor-like serine/threonine-protein kinase SD1-8 [Iris pallida]|uniref:Receptor-like serine/threonine-protein kinase SD1-8 n=1 Tax=Iris pallida TaxID=29817 RepID=A0AAX6DHB0_IRIPA|nr:receptor-like serine/threonine-protein kinase SD1-8 [Iris pallida]
MVQQHHGPQDRLGAQPRRPDRQLHRRHALPHRRRDALAHCRWGLQHSHKVCIIIIIISPGGKSTAAGQRKLGADSGGGGGKQLAELRPPHRHVARGMKLGLDRTTGLRRNLTSWKATADPSRGLYCAATDSDTEIYLYSSSSSAKIWRSGSWDGINLSRNGLTYRYVNTPLELSFSFQPSAKLVIFTASPSVKAQWLTWTPGSGRWDTISDEPANQCDTYGHCGPNGLCDINASPICSCLQGYLPKSPTKWASRNWADGCVRKTGPDCKNGTDSFATVSGAKLPEAPSSLWTTAFSLNECRLMCLRNCSCTAYAMDGSKSGCVTWVTASLLDV